MATLRPSTRTTHLRQRKTTPRQSRTIPQQTHYALIISLRRGPDLNREIRKESGLAIHRSTRLCHRGNTFKRKTPCFLSISLHKTAYMSLFLTISLIHHTHQTFIKKQSCHSAHHSGVEQSGVLDGLITRRSLVQIQSPLFPLLFFPDRNPY